MERYEKLDRAKVGQLTDVIGRTLAIASTTATADELAMAAMLALVGALSSKMKPERIVVLLLKTLAAAAQEHG